MAQGRHAHILGEPGTQQVFGGGVEELNEKLTVSF